MAKPEWMPQRLYQWVKPRSLILHAVYVACSTGCLIAMWWQIHRAMQGNVLSYLYSVEWPTFVVVGGIGWWQLFHDTPEFIAERRAYHQRMRRASAEVVARTLPRSALALTVDSHDLPANRLGAGLSGPQLQAAAAGGDPQAAGGPATPAVAHGGVPRNSALRGPASGEAATLILSGSNDRALDGSRLGGSGYLASSDGIRSDGTDGDVEDEMTQYNRYLALLAVRGKAKTWRNPHGFKAEGSS